MSRGSIFKKDERWAFRVDAGVNPETGKRRQMLRQGFATKRAAEKALAAAQQSVEQGSVVSKSSMKVDAFLDEWLASQQGRLKASTHHSYVITSKRIRSGLGRVQVQSLTPMQIESFYSDLLDHGRADGTGLSPKTVRNTHTVLRKALSDAQRLGLVYRNAADAARGPSVERPEFRVWSSDELRQFFATAEANRLGAAFVMLATTGLRRGEVLGVRWRDLDLDARTLSVVQTITNVDGKLVFGKPKTSKSVRQISIDERTAAMMRQHRRAQREDQMAMGPEWGNDGDLAFTDEAGGSIRPEWFSKEFGRVVAASGVPRIRLHDVRHTYATIALKTGIPAKVVSEHLGHSTIAITLDLYSHVTPGIDRDATDRISAAMFGE